MSILLPMGQLCVVKNTRFYGQLMVLQTQGSQTALQKLMGFIFTFPSLPCE